MVELKPIIVNVVTSAWLDKLDIENLVRHLPKSLYEPELFPGLIYHRQVPKATIIMFASGRIVSTGAKSVEDANTSLIVSVNEINEITNNRMNLREKKIENIVVKADLKNKIDLIKIGKLHKNAKYDPQSFPAAIIINKPNPSCLIFGNGKIILAGAKSAKQAYLAVEEITKEIIKMNCVSSN